LDVDAHELALLVGRIRIGLADHLDDADDAFLVAGVIEERALATLHRLEMAAGAEIAHAGPRLAFVSLLDLMLPAEVLRLRLQQPVRHRTSPPSPFVIAGLEPAIHRLKSIPSLDGCAGQVRA